MAFKPVGIDENSLFPDRVETRLSTTIDGKVATGVLPKLNKTDAAATYAPIGLLPSVPAYGVTPANLSKFRAKLSATRVGIGPMKVLCVGDSTTLGFGGGGSYQWAFPARLKALLNTYLAPTVDGLSIPPNVANDTRWATGAGWALSGSVGWGGVSSYLAATSATGNLTYTPGVNVDSFDVYFFTSANNGTFGASINGGAVTNTSTAAASGVSKMTITATASAANVLTITPPTGGSVYILGVDAYLSTAKNIRVGNAGVSGSTSTGWVNGGGFSPMNAIKSYAPDLTILMLGINDATAPLSTASHTLYIEQIIDAAKVSGDVLVLSVVPSSDSRAAQEALYRDADKASAVAKGAGFIDIYARFNTHAAASALGFMSDAAHPNNLGYGDIAGAVFSTLSAV